MPRARRPTRRGRYQSLRPCGGPLAQHGAGNELGGDRSRHLRKEPDRDELQCVPKACCLRQQSQHDEAKAQVVRLGERVHACEGVRKAQQSHCACHEEEAACRNADNGEKIKRACHLSSFRCSEALAKPAAPRTKATDRKAASSARINATSVIGVASVAPASRRRMATPQVPMSWAAIKRSASLGP